MSHLNRTHGMTFSPEYWAWSNMIQRCTNPRNASYEDYGGRGVTVCDLWLRGDDAKSGFELFFAEIGARPSPHHSVERIANSKNYEPGNIRWATRSEQANNKRNSRFVVYRGRAMTVTNAVRLAGSIVHPDAAYFRLNHGWSIDAAVETPPKKYGRAGGRP